MIISKNIKNKINFAILAVGFFVSSFAQALGWSDCVTVTGVTNTNKDSSLYSFSPGIPGCAAYLTQGVAAPGELAVNPETITSTLALGLAAQLTGQRVMVAYGSANGLCYVTYLAVGGYQGQCK